MPRRISIKPARPADRYAAPRERIAEVFSPASPDHPARGCLVSVREVENAGTGHRGLVIEVYRADPGVFVRINGRDYRAAR
jgi:hypothetical protein